MDPIMQLLAHDKSDKKRFGPLGKAHKIPEDPDTMKAYIRLSEQKSPKKFEFLSVLVESKVLATLSNRLTISTGSRIIGAGWLELMTLKTADNSMLGFFRGKADRITNIFELTEMICTPMQRHTNEQNVALPAFQLQCDQVGYKTEYPLTQGIVLYCAKKDMYHLHAILEELYPPANNFPFFTFWTIDGSSPDIKIKIFRQHKLRIQGENMMDCSMGNFANLDTPTRTTPATTLQHFAMTLLDAAGKHICVNIDKGGQFKDSLVLVQHHQKDQVLTMITEWVQKHFNFEVNWNKAPPTCAGNYSLDAKSKTTIQKFAEIAASYDMHH
jgi:hypothetical protein